MWVASHALSVTSRKPHCFTDHTMNPSMPQATAVMVGNAMGVALALEVHEA